MATISFTFTDAHQARMVDAFCFAGGWTSELGVSKGAFAKQYAADLLKTRTLELERQMAQRAALEAAPKPTPIDIS